VRLADEYAAQAKVQDSKSASEDASGDDDKTIRQARRDDGGVA
jgi:hypothetical protein